MCLPEKWTARRGRSAVPGTLLADALVDALTRGFAIDRSHELLDGLAFLAADLFAGITHAFALVRLRRVVAADIRGHLADQLSCRCLRCLILVFSVTVILMSLRNREKNRVRKAEVQVEVLALDGGLETDALDFEILGETLADALRPCC